MKRYGLIGEKLGHSFSQYIHETLTGEPYTLHPLSREEFPAFMERREFDGLNVTIPYKRDVIPYCQKIDERARRIGAVNTIVNEGGVLTGYNTDYDGFVRLLSENGIEAAGRRALVLGGGGTSRTVRTVLSDLGALEVTVVSRSPGPGEISYEEALLKEDTRLIVNTTPVGMFPKVEGKPVSLAAFPHLEAVADVVYNPLRTRLLQEAESLSLRWAGGLFMLVSQAKAAAELFRGRSLPEDRTAEVWRSLCRQKRNLVLTGMPVSGKSTVGRMLGRQLSMEFADADERIAERAGMSIPEIFSRQGEEGFRRLEKEVLRELSVQNGLVIATGGGAVLDEENIVNLRLNGTVFFLDRPLSLLTVGKDRPLAKSPEEIAALYERRYPLYCSRCDVRIDNSGTPEEAAARIAEAV